MENPKSSAEIYCVLLKAQKALTTKIAQRNDAKSQIVRRLDDKTADDAQLVLDQFAINTAIESLMKLDATGKVTYEFPAALTAEQIARDVNALSISIPSSGQK